MLSRRRRPELQTGSSHNLSVDGEIAKCSVHDWVGPTQDVGKHLQESQDPRITIDREQSRRQFLHLAGAGALGAGAALALAPNVVKAAPPTEGSVSPDYLSLIPHATRPSGTPEDGIWIRDDGAVMQFDGTNDVLVGPTSHPSYDYIVWSPDGIVVYGQSGSTGRVLYTGSDWAAIVNSIMAGDAAVHIIYVSPNVPVSTGTNIVINNKQGLALISDAKHTRPSTRPYCRKVTIASDSASVKTKNIVLRGLQMDELLFNATGTSNINSVSLYDLTINNYGLTDRQGLRISGTRYTEYVNFFACEFFFQANDTWGVNFEATHDGTGHIHFWGCVFENSATAPGFTNCEFIRYDTSGHTGPMCSFNSCSFIRIGSTGGYLVHDRSTTQDGGPRELVFNNLYCEFFQSGMDPLILVDDASPNGKYFNITVQGAHMTVSDNFTYNWIVNNHTTVFIHRGNGLFVHGEQFTGNSNAYIGVGTPNETSTFKVKIGDFHSVRVLQDGILVGTKARALNFRNKSIVASEDIATQNNWITIDIPIYSYADYAVFYDGASTIYAKNLRTGAILTSASDVATVLNTILAVDANPVIIQLDQKVPSSTGTVTISKSDVSIICPKKQDARKLSPRIRKIVLNSAVATDTRRVVIQGISFDECLLDSANSGFDIQAVAFVWCNFNNNVTTDRNGIRVKQTSDDVRHISFYECTFRAQANSGWALKFEGGASISGSQTGNITFQNCIFENVFPATGFDMVLADTDSFVPNPVRFVDCFFDWSGATTTNTLVHVKCTGTNGGMRSLHFRGCRFGLSSTSLSSFTFLSIDTDANNEYVTVLMTDPDIIASSANTYSWIVNNNSNFLANSSLQVQGGRISGNATGFSLGTPNQTSNFKVSIKNVNGYNPQGVAAITVGASPFTYQNLDGVTEAVYGSETGASTIQDVSKNGTSIFGAVSWFTVLLEPMESVVVTWVTSAPGMTKDRK